MNIFITVGTTPFDKLMHFCDENIDTSNNIVKAQISNLAKYTPSKFESFAYTNAIKEHYEWADVIISHAGSGTLFQLLEMNKKTIFVPNNIHKDAHQNDLCRFVVDNNHAFVLNDYAELNALIEDIENYEFNTYNKETNGIAKYIVELICNTTLDLDKRI